MKCTRMERVRRWGVFSRSYYYLGHLVLYRNHVKLQWSIKKSQISFRIRIIPVSGPRGSCSQVRGITGESKSGDCQEQERGTVLSIEFDAGTASGWNWGYGNYSKYRLQLASITEECNVLKESMKDGNPEVFFIIKHCFLVFFLFIFLIYHTNLLAASCFDVRYCGLHDSICPLHLELNNFSLASPLRVGGQSSGCRVEGKIREGK